MFGRLRRFLLRAGLLRGLLGGSRGWLAVGAAAAGLGALKRAVAKEPEVVFQEELAPGQALVISHLPRVPGGTRSPRRRQAKMEA